MAFSTPATFVAGNILTAAELNTYVRDNVAWLATDSPSCRAYNTPGQSLPASITTLTFNSERYDNAAMHSTVSQTDRITVPSGGDGKYLVAGWSGVPGHATPGNYSVHRITQTGTVTLVAAQQAQNINSTAFGPWFTPIGIWSMAAADYFTSDYTHDAGGSKTMTSSEIFAFWFRT
jgi:hypothetical protein